MRRLFVATLSVMICACVPIWQQKPTIAITSADIFWDKRFPELTQLDTWRLSGRTIIRQDKEAWNAGIIWQEYKGTYQIKLQGPFAQGGVTLDGDKEYALLTMDDGQQISSTSPDALMLEALAVELPVSALRDWVRGIPYSAKDYESIEYDDDGKIIHLIQQGWAIEFKRYIPFKQYSMPSKIFIEHADQSLRVVITSWDLTTLDESKNWNSTR